MAPWQHVRRKVSGFTLPSQKWVPPIVVTFPIWPFSTEPWFEGERVQISHFRPFKKKKKTVPSLATIFLVRLKLPNYHYCSGGLSWSQKEKCWPTLEAPTGNFPPGHPGKSNKLPREKVMEMLLSRSLEVQPLFFSPVGFRVSPFFIGRFIIFQKEPPFLKWWLTSREASLRNYHGNHVAKYIISSSSKLFKVEITPVWSNLGFLVSFLGCFFHANSIFTRRFFFRLRAITTRLQLLWVKTRDLQWKLEADRLQWQMFRLLGGVKNPKKSEFNLQRG